MEAACLPVMSSEENSIAVEAGKEGRALMTKPNQTEANQIKPDQTRTNQTTRKNNLMKGVSGEPLWVVDTLE